MDHVACKQIVLPVNNPTGSLKEKRIPRPYISQLTRYGIQLDV